MHIKATARVHQNCHNAVIQLVNVVANMMVFFIREGYREPAKVSSVDDLERIRLSRHKMEKYVKNVIEYFFTFSMSSDTDVYKVTDRKSSKT